MYDCLTLVDETGRTLVDINRNGSIHGPEGLAWPDWIERCDTDIESLITEIGGTCLERMADGEQPISNMAQYAADTVAYALKGGGRARAMWDPIDYAEDPINHEAVRAYAGFLNDLVRQWQQIRPPVPGGSPLAWVWALELNGNPSRLVNLATGELWRSDGSILGLSWTSGDRMNPLSLHSSRRGEDTD
jgi:hypothetical protein